MHIIDSNFKRTIRTSHHPWKLRFTSTLIFQSIVALPLQEINMCLWGYFIVQVVGYPANLSFPISLTCLLCRPWSSLTAWRGVFRETGSREGQMDATGHEGSHAHLLQNYSSLQMKYEPECQPLTVRHHFHRTVLHWEASLWGGGGIKWTLTDPPNKAKSWGRVWGWEKRPIYCAIFNRSCWKATEKILIPYMGGF